MYQKILTYIWQCKDVIKCIILVVTNNYLLESGILSDDNKSLPTFN